jgi:hypothetical protein
MTGFVLVIAGLLYGASLMHVPTTGSWWAGLCWA